MSLNIDIFSDVVCPWCFIGKRQIETALADYARDNPVAEMPLVTWRPFQLNPQIPPEGMSRQEYLERKFGARSKDIYARVTAVGELHGIPFAFDRIVRQPNTLPIHSLLASALLAEEDGTELQSRMKEAFLRAYFLDGVDLTNLENLIAIASGAGMEHERAERALRDPGALEAVAEQERRARAMGIEGVPFFIFDGKLAVSGAQGANVLRDAMRQVASAAAAV